MLELIEGIYVLTSSVLILTIPGQLSGRQMVCMASEGQILYYLSDLYHHPMEVEHPFRIGWRGGMLLLLCSPC